MGVVVVVGRARPGLGRRSTCLRCVDAEGSSGLSARNLYDARLLIAVTFCPELSWGGGLRVEFTLRGGHYYDLQSASLSWSISRAFEPRARCGRDGGDHSTAHAVRLFDFHTRMRVHLSSGGKGAVWSDWNILSWEFREI